MGQKPALYLFDLDHTLFRVNSSAHFARFLYTKGLVSTPQVLRLVGAYVLHKVGGISLLSLHQLSFSLFQGRSRRDLQDVVCEFLDEKMETFLSPPVVAVLHEAQAAGKRTVLLSNSPSFLVEEIGRRLSIDESVGSTYAVDEKGRFSRVMESFGGQQKINYVRSSIERWQTSTEEMAAYSDSYLDLPFLEGVGHPVAVAPDRRLRAHARRKKWMVIEKRGCD